jgi:hypothetical protein
VEPFQQLTFVSGLEQITVNLPWVPVLFSPLRLLAPRSPSWQLFSPVSRFIQLVMSRALILILLSRAGIHPNPGPPLVSTFSSQTFLQWNCNGLRNSSAKLSDFISKHHIKIVCLKETKFSPASKCPFFPDYTLLCKDRQVGGGRGFAFLIHHLIPYTLIDASTALRGDITTEIFAISVTIKDEQIQVYNIYIPPSSSSPPHFKPNFASLFYFTDPDSIFLGDFNAHHALCYSASSSSQDAARRITLDDAINDSVFCAMNLDSLTHLTANSSPSSPEVSIISANLFLSATWTTYMCLSSDHLPITVNLNDDHPPARSCRTFTDFRLADWAGLLAPVNRPGRFFL